MMQARFLVFLLVLGASLSLQTGHAREAFPLTRDERPRATDYAHGESFHADIEGNRVVVRGKAGTQSAGVVLHDRVNLGEHTQIIIDVEGANAPGNLLPGDRLFKLEINERPVRTENDQSPVDGQYVRRRDGTFVFPLPEEVLRRGHIDKFEIVFWNSELNDGLQLTIWLN